MEEDIATDDIPNTIQTLCEAHDGKMNSCFLLYLYKFWYLIDRAQLAFKKLMAE